jgi:ribosome-binding protein aMBF1 (putative translation factor)
MNPASGSVAPDLRIRERPDESEFRMILLRRVLGEVLRTARMQRGLTLRELSKTARVSLGYISEIERGQKEASSELLAALCEALEVPLSDVLRDASQAVVVEELTSTPVPAPAAVPASAVRPVRTPDVVASAA